MLHGEMLRSKSYTANQNVAPDSKYHKKNTYCHTMSQLSYNNDNIAIIHQITCVTRRYLRKHIIYGNLLDLSQNDLKA